MSTQHDHDFTHEEIAFGAFCIYEEEQRKKMYSGQDAHWFMAIDRLKQIRDINSWKAKPCAYCSQNPAIKNSHILPRWTIRDSLDKSVTGKLRATDSINRRVQDGEKGELLCCECEERFSKLEGKASRQFKSGAISPGMIYDVDFLRFLVSIAWRVAVVRADEIKANYSNFSPALANAINTWKDYLEGKSSNLGKHPIWFTILNPDVAQKVHTVMRNQALGGKGAAPILNRYFVNWLGCEVVVYEKYSFAIVWAKTGSWLIAGVVTVPDEGSTPNVELSPRGGVFPSTGHAVPPILLATLGHQSWECLRVAGQMNPSQRLKIEADFKKNAAKLASSVQAQALQEDVKMFGDSAWVELPEPEKE